MTQPTIPQTFDLAVRHHQAGRLKEAAQLYQQILARQPDHAGALHYLGVYALQVGRHDAAVELIRRAVACQPGYHEAYYNLGHALKAGGQLEQAVAAYRQAIAINPQFSEAYNNLGTTLKDNGELDEAIAAYHKAIALQPDCAESHSNLGLALKEKGCLDEAITACRVAIALKPGFAEAHFNLGTALGGKDWLDDAIAAYRQAIALKPNYPEAYNNLGIALSSAGRLDEAIAAYRQALALKPNYADVHSNLGNVLRDKGQLDEAIAAYHQALALKPDYAGAYSNLGNALRDKGQLDEAIVAYRQAVALQPNWPEAHNNLGVALGGKGSFAAAVAAYQQAIALNPDYAEAHSNLGNTLRDMKRLDQAIAACRQAVALKPEMAEAHSNLAAALSDRGRLDEAIAACRQAIALKPSCAEAYCNLGHALKEQGQLDTAIAAYRQAIALKPGDIAAHSNLVYVIHFSPNFDARAIAAEHQHWNQQHAEPLKRFILAHGNDRNPDRALRIGYVSPDLRDHPIGRFLLPLLAHQDRRNYQTFAYSNVLVPDAVTQQLRAHIDEWRNLVGVGDAQAAELIRQDRIDILVDLTLHMASSRILVFAYKPAPVQVTYLAYAGTSGLTTMDYRLSDPYLDPPGGDESVYSEQTIRLPETYWCYQPVVDLPLQPSPALEKGFGTFGCLNNFCKLNELLLNLWARMLAAVPQSRLLLYAQEGQHRQRVLEHFQRAGIEPARMGFGGLASTVAHFRRYQSIDIALDTHPYGGGTTTCDALWMGVPVVSLVGDTAVGRGGLSLLSNLSLPELVAKTPDEYVRIAVDLANDLPRLRQLRSTLRQRMQASPLMDAPRFARNIEAAYRQMWHKWCGT